ncbi:type VI secretion system Vgr family protein [Trinickia caryophylli]|nr:type VI secretion system Vgr family protein [Trinickia caryophylli]PMS13823.1 type VI secretion system tip protein VgrG [Trinickia caryophylli]TRX14318.1 type VI secretion system tip protein VgrG [Trinickia caryophylli]WQE14150.1 type VI secretion system Vgr family protein [Trinickia caryophylli]GLU33351.1 hypothetical protein Busp01_31930 [Trinickia caryophylli]
MNYQDLPRVSFGPLLSQNNRAFRLKWPKSRQELNQLLLPQYLDIEETLCGGIEGSVLCVSPTAGIPLTTFMAVPLAVQLVTDSGGLRSICGIVADVQEGESDGGLAAYRLRIRDALSLLELRTKTRVFRAMSVLEVVRTLVWEWRNKSSTIAGAFDIDISNLQIDKYPSREQTNQFDESDAAFIRRLLRREGIGWYIQAGKPGEQDPSKVTAPMHTLVLYDDASQLRQCAVGTVPYGPNPTVSQRDVVKTLSEGRQLVPGAIRRFSPDYKFDHMERIQGPTRSDQGEAGNDLARLLMDSRLDSPHLANSPADYERMGLARIKSHDARAVQITGASDIRDLTVGTWVTVSARDRRNSLSTNERAITITSLHHRGENNLPKDLSERAQALFAAGRWPFEPPPVSTSTPARPTVLDQSAESRYENTFTGVPRGTPLTPAYDPRVDLPRVYPITGKVTAPDGEEVHCDEQGRVYVQIVALASEDHEHAKGMGTSGTEVDSAPVRVLTGLAGDNFGENWAPRKGMEVLLDFQGGDPDKMYVAGILHNGANMPATFNNTGALPGNRYVSGTKTKEIKGQRYNQLRFDDTPSEISVQLSSEHAASEVNLGYLTHPRTNGDGEYRGEGAELRTDAAAALRAAKGILLTTYARSKAAGHQLDRDELTQLLNECTELFKSLGDYVGQHGGKAANTTGQSAVAAALKTWQASGSGDTPGLMAFGAQAGWVSVTPKTHVTYAGENIDQVAQQDLQLTSGQRLSATAGQGMQLFARGTGVQAIAGEGPVLVQAQADTITANAQKGIKIATNENEVVITAPTIRLVAQDGSYIKIGGGVTLGTNGDISLLSASHKWGGPSTQQAAKTAFDNAPTDQRFRLHYPGEDGDKATAANQAYRITLDDGRVIEGKTDAGGLTDMVKDDAMRILKVDILKPSL